MPSDEGFMERALELAERGRATVRPNPLVGCVVVRDGRIVGEGWHERAGGPHAEVTALRAAGGSARGATVYVTLEPCAHTGRTPPCAPAILDAGVVRVVYAAADPNPRATGGAEALRAAGVGVDGGVLEDRARLQNEVFFHVHERGRAHLTLKLAQSLDGRVAARDGSSRWITGKEARSAVHGLRALADVVLVGSATVLADDPALTVRHVPAPAGQPRPAVLDARGRTPPDARVVRDGALVFTSERSDPGWRERLAERGADVVLVPEATSGVDAAACLAWLRERELHAVLCEGGPTVATSLVRAGLVDRLILHVGGLVLGPDALPVFAGEGAATIADAWRWRIESVERLGQDVIISARPEAGGTSLRPEAGGTSLRPEAGDTSSHPEAGDREEAHGVHRHR